MFSEIVSVTLKGITLYLCLNREQNVIVFRVENKIFQIPEYLHGNHTFFGEYVIFV